ncbi:MAG: EAL domain-containing protein [Pantoea sp.]|nr:MULTISPECIES: EAL domain-containing protein [Pantoea]MDU5780815.1 EAL domain-containing protein [Pantoea sp.]
MNSHSLASTLSKKFILEPVMSQSGRFVGFELLTRYTSLAGKSRNPFMVIENMPCSEKRDLLYEQLGDLSPVVALLEAHHLFVSINVDRDMVTMLEEDARLGWLLSTASVIRLEVSEAIDFHQDHEARETLHRLKARGIRFFLDDLGTGFANLEALYTGLFEAVKIDKRFFWEQKDKSIFPVLMANIQRYCPQIIVEGVENKEDLAALEHIPLYGLQGYYFSALEIEDLPQFFS